jgi:hypothetical protein
VDLKRYLLDTSEADNLGNTFSNIKGINNLEIRDIKFYSVADSKFIDPYDYGDILYPQFSKDINST